MFLPHYVGAALSTDGLRESPWDVVVAVCVILGIAAVRLFRHSRMHTTGLVVAVLDLAVQLVIVILGLALLFSPETLVDGFDLSAGQGWDDLAFALPLAMLAYTGLETVANLAEETREPGKTLPRSLFSAIGLVVVLTVLVAVVGLSAFPGDDGTTALGEEWLEAPMVGIATAFEGELPGGLVDVLRVVVGLSGALILFTAAVTSMSGCTRLAHSMASHGMLPRELGRFERRSLVSREAIVLIALIAAAIVWSRVSRSTTTSAGLASVYSFGILLAFTAAQLAVIRLRAREPELPRPFRARPEVTIRGVRLPLPALVGAVLTAAVWVLALVTHPGARYVGPAWLVLGLTVYWLVRIRADRGLLEDVAPVAELPPGAEFRRVLVPMKLGDVGEEMVATAVALAKEREAVGGGALRRPRAASLPARRAPAPRCRRAGTGVARRGAGARGGQRRPRRGIVVRAREIGPAIVEEARGRNVDLVVLGSAPRWRRQSRFWSPTVDHVLRHSPCEVLVVAFPDGVFEEG